MSQFDSLALRYQDGKVFLLDQTLLPHEERWLEASLVTTMIEAIKLLRVRGAPLIGVAAAFALGSLSRKGAKADEIRAAGRALREARPTAVNLAGAVDRCLKALDSDEDIEALALKIAEEDVELCQKIARFGAPLVPDGRCVMTICNAGGLATAGMGTAVGVLLQAWAEGKRFEVVVPETRPLGQGARLTTWELSRAGIPFTLICDNMVGYAMCEKRVAFAVVGADRIARNGDFANKIGTYNMAILAKYHGVPFYTAAPYTTFDLDCVSGSEIPIELRHSDEVRGTYALRGCEALNPAFDVTPASLVSGWITDKGLVREAGRLFPKCNLD